MIWCSVRKGYPHNTIRKIEVESTGQSDSIHLCKKEQTEGLSHCPTPAQRRARVQKDCLLIGWYLSLKIQHKHYGKAVLWKTVLESHKAKKWFLLLPF